MNNHHDTQEKQPSCQEVAWRAARARESAETARALSGECQQVHLFLKSALHIVDISVLAMEALRKNGFTKNWSLCIAHR